MTYAGPYDAWDMKQAAIAAARYPEFEPTWDGLNKLQERWWASGAPRPGTIVFEGIDTPMDMTWAMKAFLHVNTNL